MRKERIILPFVLMCTIFLNASEPQYRGSVPTLISITVKQALGPNDTTQLAVGASRQFTATGNYSDGSTRYLTQRVTWTSSNTAIATVSAKMGLVSAVSAGTVDINATLNGIVGSSSLTVVAATFVGVVITPATISLQAGTTQQFNATAEFSASPIQDVSSSASWKSSNPHVATVSATGLVTTLGPGTTLISAKFNNREGLTTLTVTSTAPPNLGLWSAPQSLGMVGINAALLNTGKVLFFEYPAPSPARVYDPIANSVTDVTVPAQIDLFCAGQSFLPDGRLFVAGGTDDTKYPLEAGIYNAGFFDPQSNTWTLAPSMHYARWYPTTVPMPDGTIFVLAGTDENGKNIQRATESYNPATNTWTELPASAYMPTHPDNYPLMTVLANGNVFYAAPRQDSYMYNPAAQAWSFVSNMNFGKRFHAGVALLPGSQKVMVVGGASSDDHDGTGPTNTTEVIDFSMSDPLWSYAAPMNIARYNENLVYLADGTLLALGGNQKFKYIDPVRQPELYNPATATWTLMNPQVALRGYHSTAILLPDGRVLSAGSDSQDPLEKTYEIFTPPYLFNGSRPTISSAPGSVVYGQQFTIATPDAASIQRVALIRPGATTHANHMDDHYYIDLAWSAGSGQLNLTAPSSPNQAPPGYYLLVIVNSNGVPSVMPFLQLQTALKSSQTLTK